MKHHFEKYGSRSVSDDIVLQMIEYFTTGYKEFDQKYTQK